MERDRLTGVERTFGEDELVVSKTDLQGRITYANDVFARVSGYSEAELVGQPHSLVRHPDMPRCVFQLLWDRIQSGREVFAYVLNRAKNGDHYWVFAHVTPSRDEKGRATGYHSNRRCPDRAHVERWTRIYERLLAAESGAADKRSAIAASSAVLARYLETERTTFEELALAP